jgi:hypothetical protein
MTVILFTDLMKALNRSDLLIWMDGETSGLFDMSTKKHDNSTQNQY